MGQHKIETDKKKPEVKYETITFNTTKKLAARVEAARLKTQVPVTDAEGKQVSTRVPSRGEALELFLVTFLDLFDKAAAHAERQHALVVTPEEFTRSGAALPPDLMRKA